MKIVIVTVVFLSFTIQSIAQVVINEIMQSNIDCIMDDLNEFPDSWVELYNDSNDDVSLKDYSLGLTDDPQTAWHLPNLKIEAKSYILVFCDKQEQGLHSNFRLESGKGGALYLFQNDVVVDKITKLSKQPAPNIAYGRIVDASTTWGYQEVPTPYKKNIGSILDTILPEPIIDQKGVVKSDNAPIGVKITMPKGTPDGTKIYYTLNGCEPDENSSIYPDDGLTINTTSVLRVKPFCKGYLSPRSITQSYIYHPREVTLPVISIVTDEKYFYDNGIGIFSNNIHAGDSANYKYDWRRPINFEYYDDKYNYKQVVNQLCETRVSGGASRVHPLKSLAVYANKRFGEKRFSHEFFPELKPGITEFKSLLLRNTGNDFASLYMRDAAIHGVVGGDNLDIDYQAFQPSILYINGTYKGIIYIRERSNEDNIYSNYDGLEDIDMIENLREVKAGDIKSFEDFCAFYKDPSHTFEDFQEVMDIDEYINLMIAELFFVNRDFYCNNIVCWKERNEYGKWRWIMKDMDFGMGYIDPDPQYDIFPWIYGEYDPRRPTNNKPVYTELFRNLMNHKEFRNKFIDLSSIYIGSAYNSNQVKTIVTDLREKIWTEYQYHRTLYSDASWQPYEQQWGKLLDWIDQRPKHYLSTLANFYGEKLIDIEIVNNVDWSNISLWGHNIDTTKFVTQYCQGHLLKLKVLDEVTNIVGWKLSSYKNNECDYVFINQPSFEYTIPSCDSIKIEALSSTSDIHNTKGYNTYISIDSRDLIIRPERPLNCLHVFNIDGSLLESRSKVIGNQRIPLPHKGIYVLEIDGMSEKIVVN